MSDDRKKPIWPWIAVLLIGLPVLYVASFGPACWIAFRIERGGLPAPFIAYEPVRLACKAMPPFGDAMDRYANFLMPPESSLSVSDGWWNVYIDFD